MIKTRLLVVVPGLHGKLARWDRLIARLKQEPTLTEDECVWLVHDPKSRPLGLMRVAEMTRNLVACIDQEWVRNGGFQEIILVGHSLGGLMVRGAYVTGRGGNPNQPQKHDWAAAVTRIILFASPNRGIERLDNAFLRGFDWLLRHLVPLDFTYQDLMRGSNFVTNLRINWIRIFAPVTKQLAQLDGQAQQIFQTHPDPDEPRLPVVVQLLGSHDRSVHRDDSIDVLSSSTAVAGEIPDANHENLPDLDSAPDPEGRYLMLKTAILTPDALPVREDGAAMPKVIRARHVVFILHGIRASSIDKWLRHVAKQVRAAYPPDTDVRRPSYGYFTALSFAFPALRRRNIHHFQDAYTEALARHPDARFDFIGHSNGTYMLGQSLRDVSSMKFRNVLLAGSVLPPDYPWDGKLGHQVERVRSERGRMDWPVGWLCSALNEGLGMKDIGTGGYTGFIRGQVEEEQFHPGGHGSMFREDTIPGMVAWLNGGPSGIQLPGVVDELPWWSLLSRLFPHVLRIVLLALIFWIG